LRIDGHRTELTDAVVEEPIEGKNLGWTIAEVRGRAHPPARMGHVPRDKGATAFGATPERMRSRGHGAVFVPSDVSICARWSLPE
jgi:hypothetical protein